MSDKDQLPLFTCKSWIDYYKKNDFYDGENLYTNLGLYYCIAEKGVDVTALILIGFTVWQLYVYVSHHHVRLSDLRIIIFFISIICLVHSFIHYSFISGEAKIKTFFVIELQRLVIFFMMCYYYIDQAGNLLKHKNL